METITVLGNVNLVSVMARIILALLMGGVLGAERGLRNRPADFMTYVLVCMGSTMIMLTNQYICTVFPGTDPTRLGAQVVSGVGFWGAGTIIVQFRETAWGKSSGVNYVYFDHASNAICRF